MPTKKFANSKDWSLSSKILQKVFWLVDSSTIIYSFAIFEFEINYGLHFCKLIWKYCKSFPKFFSFHRKSYQSEFSSCLQSNAIAVWQAFQSTRYQIRHQARAVLVEPKLWKLICSLTGFSSKRFQLAKCPGSNYLIKEISVNW